MVVCWLAAWHIMMMTNDRRWWVIPTRAASKQTRLLLMKLLMEHGRVMMLAKMMVMVRFGGYHHRAVALNMIGRCRRHTMLGRRYERRSWGHLIMAVCRMRVEYFISHSWAILGDTSF